MTTNYFIYCDKCGKPIVKQDGFEHLNYNLCPECVMELYQKIFQYQQWGDEE